MAVIFNCAMLLQEAFSVYMDISFGFMLEVISPSRNAFSHHIILSVLMLLLLSSDPVVTYRYLTSGT
jgi:hypothetical protein